MGVELGKEFSLLEDDGVKPRIMYMGVFDFEGLYRMMRTWIVDKRFVFQETLYKDKLYTPLGNEIEIKWEAWKKATDMIKEVITVHIHMWDAAEVDVIKDGKKAKLMRARMIITMDARMTLDYNKRFSGRFSKKMGDVYYNKIINWEWKLKYGQPLIYSVYDLHKKVKKFLNMETDSSAY